MLAGLLIFGGLGVIAYRVYNMKVSSVKTIYNYEILSNILTRHYAEMTKVKTIKTKNNEDYKRELILRRNIETALKKCVYGEPNSKAVVINVNRAILNVLLPTLNDINHIINFKDVTMLPVDIVWECLIYFLSKEHGKNTVSYILDKYELYVPRLQSNGLTRLEVSTDDIYYIYEAEGLPTALNYDEALDILSIIFYNDKKGYKQVETLMHQNIDGLELGTVGSIRYKILNTRPTYKIEQSCSIQFRTKWIHLSFINFGSEEEIKRLVINISNVPGSVPLTNKSPIKVVDAYDGSRITCIRPDVGATWGLFMRSFSAGVVSVEAWLNKPEIKNWELVDELLHYLALSEQNMAVTGQQNTGKTTLMKGLIAYYPNINIRLLEMSFELNLNEIYPDRNIFCVKPTEYANSSRVQDTLKKTDAWLSLAGEVAEDIVAANMIQFGLVASACTLFSHHGKDYQGLINGLTGSLISCGAYTDYNIAQGLVLDVVKHNVHCNFAGNIRVVEYVEEIVKGVSNPYYKLKKSNSVEDAIDQLTKIQRQYYEKTTENYTYDRREIIRFNKATMTYEPGEWYTPERFKEILHKLPVEERQNFINFYHKHWG